jgi:AraC family transcriptional regulator of adaptative response/methylated-DNA-[protein]-cysteine methyltransferase
MVFMSETFSQIEIAGSATAVDPEFAWSKLMARDPAAPFFYAVTTTGIFCRPSCASRRPLKSNVRFFASVFQAREAGFRPCLRCQPEAPTAPDFPLEKIRSHIEANFDRPLPLVKLARLADCSPFTLQRLFKRQFGVSPLQYQRALRAGQLRDALKQGASVTTAIYDAGFGSSSRGYAGAQLGMTPARFAAGGQGEQIRFATAASAFGWIIVGATQRGLCWLALAATKAEAEASLRNEFPAASLHPDAALSQWVDAALAVVNGPTNSSKHLAASQALLLDLRGTEFQLRVWQALREIPRGETRSYSQLAKELGNAKATRAVARACAMNRVALMVPCHRVVGVGGSLTGYRWGVERKRQLLNAEAADSGPRT